MESKKLYFIQQNEILQVDTEQKPRNPGITNPTHEATRSMQPHTKSIIRASKLYRSQYVAKIASRNER